MKKIIFKAGAWIFIISLIIVTGLIFSGCEKARGERIGEERAIELAFSHFNLSPEDCTVKRTEFDDGKYEIEFHCGDKEYDVEIDAYSGKVWERDVEYNDDYIDTTARDTTATLDTTAKAEDEIISADRAKEIAIEYFSLNIEECRFMRAERDGRKYEIEFVCNEKEYEVDVDVRTGQVLEADVDSIYD